jgi:hypothetical protein
MAVAAIDSALQPAGFSAGGINLNGGEVNIAAPGVRVKSSFPLPKRHEIMDGTSMATPHVAGIAALYAEANPSARGRQLWDLIANSALELHFDSRDVGSGLVQAPTSGTTPRSRSRRPVSALETSPIIIGGGGSTGVDFDETRYIRTASGNVFVGANESLRTCHVMHQNGKLLRNFFPDIDGKQCAVTIECKKAGVLIPNTIRIMGGPSGQLTIFFNESEFPFDQAKGVRLGADLKVFSVTVQNLVTGNTTAPLLVPDGWAGIIHIDN